ncbi:MAG: hypothetical protein KGS45_01075 [Planctomycetes bacterium]|nr:hypothetical protein [Planctomycetota bacterium]
MSSTPFQPGHRFSDDELLAFVEGELTADHADRLSMRLLADPDLYRRLEQMRIHRSVLMSMPDAAAPADLADRVQQILEQRSLLDAPVGVDTLTPGSLRLISDGTPISGVRRATTLPRASWWQQRGALAAGIALLLCGSAYWGYTAIRKTLPPTLEPIAINTGTNAEKGTITEKGTGGATPTADMNPETGAIAARNASTESGITNDGPSDTDIAHAARLEDDPIEAILEQARPTLADLASSISLPDRPMSEQDALRLAREGRLAIRINTLQPTHAGRGMEKLTQANSETARSWRFGRLEGTHAASVRAALDTTSQVHARLTAERKERQAAVAIDDAARFAHGLGPIQFPNALPPMAPASKLSGKFEADPTRPLYTVECDAKVGSLNAVRGLVTEYTRSSITFIELAEPVSAATDDAAVVWWTLPPAQWAPRIHVPVVIGN